MEEEMEESEPMEDEVEDDMLMEEDPATVLASVKPPVSGSSTLRERCQRDHRRRDIWR